jgi:hypothetical protein
MTKGSSEATVAKALSEIDDPIVAVWKPPDDARNWKPADYLVWYSTYAAMIEVKDCAALRGFPLSDLRPTQRAWAWRCKEVGIPYLLVIHWQRTQDWTISDTLKVLEWEREDVFHKSVPRALLQGGFGVQTDGRLLAATLRLALLGEM